jgi:hypothetical protein
LNVETDDRSNEESVLNGLDLRSPFLLHCLSRYRNLALGQRIEDTKQRMSCCPILFPVRNLPSSDADISVGISHTRSDKKRVDGDIAALSDGADR